ncbi:MAG: TIM barrel protein [Armatimonadetes bacterium]|nr:TIM barrel protein [Armatimonadota bacterium]
MTRREVLKSGVAAGATLAAGTAVAAATGGTLATKRPFKLKYAPHFGMFQNSAGPDPIDQLKFAADEGFQAWEDNGMKGRSVEEQEKIAKAMQKLGIQMGIFVVNPEVAWTPFLSTGSKEGVEAFVKECKSAIEVCKRVNAKWMTLVPGVADGRLDRGYQVANVIDGLRKGAEVLEPHGLVMVMEALNSRRDHPGMVLNRVADNYLMVRGVNSPALKILFDLYHQAVDDGNLIPHMDLCWNEIAYIQTGDHPGRNEPGTGEVNYRAIFQHIHSRGYQGILGMEHGNSKPGKEGERAVIAAYRAADDF